MKKIVSLALFFVLLAAMLVSCTKPEIGDGIHDYPETAETVERLDLNMYIITGDDTTKNATESVATRISGHTKITYNTTLNITYVKESEYDATVKAAIANGGKNAPHIVLINSLELFDALKAENKLADLTPYYASRDFGRLNSQLTPSLLAKSYVDGKLYTVPNNHLIGEYTYLVINKDIAMKTLHYGNELLSSYTSLEDAAELMEEMKNAGYNAEELVRLVSGPYEIREELSVENFCNIVSVPEVTKADAFSSAFAVVNNAETKYNDRAMQIIYQINNDNELRNFLQYGVLGANYEVVDGDIVRIKDGENTYNMKLEYTGNMFEAENCSELGWTDAKKAYAILQNNDSVPAEE